MNLLQMLDKGIDFVKTEISMAYHSLREFDKNYMRLGKVVKKRTKRFLLDREYIADVVSFVGGITMPISELRHYIWTKKGYDTYKRLRMLRPILE